MIVYSELDRLDTLSKLRSMQSLVFDADRDNRNCRIHFV